MEQIIPDSLDLEAIESQHPNLPSADKYRLAQASTLLRLTKCESLSELEQLLAHGEGEHELSRLISAHNSVMRRTDPLSG